MIPAGFADVAVRALWIVLAWLAVIVGTTLACAAVVMVLGVVG